MFKGIMDAWKFALLVSRMNMVTHKKGIANKVITIVIGGVIAFFVLSALLPTFLTSLDTLNTTIGASKITGKNGLQSMLYLMPFLLVIGALVALIAIMWHKKSGGSWG